MQDEERCTKAAHLPVGVGLRTAALQDQHHVDFLRLEIWFTIIRNVKTEMKPLNVSTEKETIML